MANEVPVPADGDIREQAAQHTLAANPLVGVRGQDILDSARLLLGQILSNPVAAAEQYLTLLAELGRIATGASELAPDTRDRRFADPAWMESVAYRSLAQSYLAWGNALYRFLDQAKIDKRDAERARFVVSLLVDAMAPTNSLAGNPPRRSRSSSIPAARASCTGWRISSAISWGTAGCRRRSTGGPLPSARISRPRLARSCIAPR
jgi:poly[(R)-3-hydroxyalkanoate] polymerase subunit PhaC